MTLLQRQSNLACHTLQSFQNQLMEDAEPYFEDEHYVGRILIRKTKGEANWMRFQAGKNVREHRDYWIHKANHISGLPGVRFNEPVTVFHLLGYGETEGEAFKMAQAHGY